jgi:hypothetical protein
MLGGIDWAGLEIAAEIVGVADIEELVAHLEMIRDNKTKARPENEH